LLVAIPIPEVSGIERQKSSRVRGSAADWQNVSDCDRISGMGARLDCIYQLLSDMLLLKWHNSCFHPNMRLSSITCVRNHAKAVVVSIVLLQD
jgi:hypothetical protein